MPHSAILDRAEAERRFGKDVIDWVLGEPPTEVMPIAVVGPPKSRQPIFASDLGRKQYRRAVLDRQPGGRQLRGPGA